MKCVMCRGTGSEGHACTSVDCCDQCSHCDGTGREPAEDPAPLPRIVRFLGTDDSPDSECPHCGARGRFIHSFIVEDGRRLAAMSGCVKLFPVSRVALEEQRLRKKAADRAKKGWVLNRDDRRALDAIERYFAGELEERYALSLVDSAKANNVNRARSYRK